MTDNITYFVILTFMMGQHRRWHIQSQQGERHHLLDVKVADTDGEDDGGGSDDYCGGNGIDGNSWMVMAGIAEWQRRGLRPIQQRHAGGGGWLSSIYPLFVSQQFSLAALVVAFLAILGGGEDSDFWR